MVLLLLIVSEITELQTKWIIQTTGVLSIAEISNQEYFSVMGIYVLLQGTFFFWLCIEVGICFFLSFQLLHICIEGWGNWRWSEPFSVDNTGTFIRTIQYKGRTASLIIKVQQLSGVQKQVRI